MQTQNINININTNEPATKKKAKEQYRLSVPVADTSVIEWLNAQVSISNSIRLLVREHIIREGYTDPTCRQIVNQTTSEPKAITVTLND